MIITIILLVIFTETFAGIRSSLFLIKPPQATNKQLQTTSKQPQTATPAHQTNSRTR